MPFACPFQGCVPYRSAADPRDQVDQLASLLGLQPFAVLLRVPPIVVEALLDERQLVVRQRTDINGELYHAPQVTHWNRRRLDGGALPATTVTSVHVGVDLL